MKVTLNVAGTPTHTASEMLLGQNIETCIDTVPGLLSDRLDNPKLLGPGHPLTGIPPGWQGGSCQSTLGIRLSPGAGLLGTDALYLQSSWEAAITQGNRKIAAGETLVAELWARCLGKPVPLVISLLPMPIRQVPHATAEIVVDCPQFTRYTVELPVPVDDDEACFSIAIKKEPDGDIVPDLTVCFDQIHLRPKGEELLCATVIEELAAMQIPSIRFPGGIVTTNYNWKHGTGPVHLRPTLHDGAFFRDWYIHYDFGTDEYLQVCLDQGITPAITLNVGTGNADEAREWAEYTATFYKDRNIDPPLVYWQIGNHPYHATMAWMTPEMYVRTVKEYAAAIREAYPNSRIVGVAPSPVSDDEEGEWVTRTLDEAGDLLDVIMSQTYGGQPIHPKHLDPEVWKAGTSDPTEMMTHMVWDIAGLQECMMRMVAACRKRGLATNVGIAEWNYWISASHRDGHKFYEPDDALHALFIAGMLNGFTALAPDMEAAHYYNLVNCMGIIHHRGPETVVHAGVDVFKMYRPAFPGEVLPVEIDAPDFGGKKQVSVAALKAGGKTHLLVVNYSATEAADVTIGGFGTPSESVCIAAADPRERPQPVEVTTGPGSANLPPLSVARLSFE